MQGLGNDFIVIDNRNEAIDPAEAPSLARKLCERRFSVGAEGILLISNSKVADVKMRKFNIDGSEAEMCGNGIRCFAKYCYENNIVHDPGFNVETKGGIRRVWLTLENEIVKLVRVDMGTPIWERSVLPMLGTGSFIYETLEVDGEKYNVTCLSMGNPHCVMLVGNVSDFPVRILGPKIANHKLFPKRTNVEFFEVINRENIKLRVWERACGETLACGTGACASVATGIILKKLANTVTVHMAGGTLKIDQAEKIFMTGPAEKVFEGLVSKVP